MRSGAPEHAPSGTRVGGAARGRRAAGGRGRGEEEGRSAAAAWRESRELVWVHRRRLAIGLALMMISRLAGIVLPALVEVRHRRRDRQGPARSADADRAGRRRRHDRPGDHQLRPLADPRRGRAARHHRHAQARAGQDHAPAGALFRLHADRRAAVAHHERRRRHPQPGRHRPGAAGRRHGHRDHQPRRAALPQLAPDARHGRRARRCSAAAWPTRSSGCGRCSASAARSRRRSPAGSPKRSAASASSRATPPRSAKRSSSPRARTGCSATSRSR